MKRNKMVQKEGTRRSKSKSLLYIGNKRNAIYEVLHHDSDYELYGANVVYTMKKAHYGF